MLTKTFIGNNFKIIERTTTIIIKAKDNIGKTKC